MDPRNPYERPTQPSIWVPASMLEAIAGYEDEARVDRELAFAVNALDESDPASIRWLITVLGAKLDYLPPVPGCTGYINEQGQFAHDGGTCPVHEESG